MPLISVITPVYNNKKYLRNCVDSVANQGFEDYEHIIVDDGSTDGTSELCDEIARVNSKIRVIHQKNQWIYASFNNGISVASGEYVYIVNSDDTLDTNTFTQLVKIVNEYHPDVIWTSVIEKIYDETSNTMISSNITGLAKKQFERNFFLKDKDMLHAYWRDLYLYGFTMNQANLYKRDLMLKHPFRNDYYGADSLFNISIADDIETSYILSNPIYNFFRYNNGEMNASVGKIYGYEFDMFHEILGGHINLIRKWNGSESDLLYFENTLVKTCLNCIQVLDNPKFTYTANDKLKILIQDYFTNDFLEENKELGCFEEIDARITKEIMKYVIKDEILPEDDYFFFVEMINSLNKNPKSDKDYDNIEKAINHILNPCHYGISICKRMGLFD